MVPHDASLHRPGPETSVFVIGDRARRFQPFEFLELIGHTEANDLAQIVASLLDPLVLPLRHPAALRDHVDEHPHVACGDLFLLPEQKTLCFLALRRMEI